jgi:Transposase
MDKYIGLDVHAASCTAAIIDPRGKRLGHHVIETNGQALVEFFRMQAGTVHVCIEEGGQAGWLVEILSPHVERIVTLRVQESRGAKSDERDAFGLAERLRTGAIDTGVYKLVGPFATLRQLVKAHQMIVRDSGTWIGIMPAWEQRLEGAMINWFYINNGLQAGDPFYVIVVDHPVMGQ